jgi:hypothetical protein
MKEWGARSFQSVWFTAGPRIPADELYRRTFGKGPETHYSSSGQSLATGSTLTGEYRFQEQPGRTDFFLLPTASTAAVGQPPVLMLIPEIDAAMKEFSSNLEGACPAVGDAYRLALIVTVSAQAETREQAATSVLDLIGMSLPFADASDLLFQVNRQQELRDTRLTMNRVLQWRSETIQQIVRRRMLCDSLRRWVTGGSGSVVGLN